MSDIVTVNSGMSYQDILKGIAHLGELRVAKATVTDGVATIEFRQRTFREWIEENFSRNGALHKKDARSNVLKALERLIQQSEYPDQLLQNVRDRVAHNVGISGRSLVRDYGPVVKGKRPMPLRGGMIAAISKGNSIQLVGGDPAKIKCAHAVLRTSTAINEAARHPTCSQLRKKLEKFQQSDPRVSGIVARDQPIPVGITKDPIEVNLAAKSWTCVTDLRLPELQSNQANVSTQMLEKLLEASVNDQEGAVVIEIIPDFYVEKYNDKTQKPVGTYSYTQKGILTQILTARRLVAEAKSSNRALVITFASTDRSAVEQMKNMGKRSTAKLESLLKQETPSRKE